MDIHTSYFNFLDALREEGCSICFLLKKTIHKLMDDFLYEQVNDPGVRKEIRESLGFCSAHAWELQKFGDGFGSSIIYEDLMELVANYIEKIIVSGKSVKDFSAEISKVNSKDYYKRTKAACPMCKSRREAEKRYVSTFIEGFHEPEFYSSYKNSFGLCLPHLIEAIKDCREKKTINSLLNIESEKMKGLIGELKEIQRKHDYRFSHEGFGKEGNAWIRAIEKMVGKEGVF